MCQTFLTLAQTREKKLRKKKKMKFTRAQSLQVLGLDDYATVKDIRLRYLKLAKRMHPDKSNLPDAKLRFQRIGAAYRRLVNSEQEDDDDDEENRQNGDMFSFNGHSGCSGSGDELCRAFATFEAALRVEQECCEAPECEINLASWSQCVAMLSESDSDELFFDGDDENDEDEAFFERGLFAPSESADNEVSADGNAEYGSNNDDDDGDDKSGAASFMWPTFGSCGIRQRRRHRHQQQRIKDVDDQGNESETLVDDDSDQNDDDDDDNDDTDDDVEEEADFFRPSSPTSLRMFGCCSGVRYACDNSGSNNERDFLPLPCLVFCR
jgi:curved DNA-binding protein CbpA